jgi:hypothetical protein
LVIELRPSLLHGDDELTEFQMSSTPKSLTLKKNLRRVLEIDTHGRWLDLGKRTPLAAFHISRGFVDHLDSKVLVVHPKVRR